MIFLSLCCSAVFYYKYPTPLGEFLFADWLKCLIPITLSAFVAVLVVSTYNYGKMLRKYQEKWEKAKAEITKAQSE